MSYQSADNRQIPTRQSAEQRVADARAAKEPGAVASALVDLGIVCKRARELSYATEVLEEALALARQTRCAAFEGDALNNLGQVLLSARKPSCARDRFAAQLEIAKATGDRLSEKLALGWLAVTYSATDDHAQAVPLGEQALVLARDLADREHQAKLLWQLSIDHSELGQRRQAIACADDAITLLRHMGSPEADLLADAVARYRTTAATSLPVQAHAFAQPSPGFGSSMVVGIGVASRRPGLLRMALAAAKSAARFASSGLKTVPPEVCKARLDVCSTCEHHTGLRCRACGCFTTPKAWLPHEECPIGKWPGHAP